MKTLNAQGWRSALAELRTQWRANPRLRVGAAVIAGIVWLWAALVVLDEAKLLRDQALTVQAEQEQLAPLVTQTQWRARADEARALVDAARELQWTATSTGAGEAKLQDVLRELCAKAGLVVVELAVVQGAASSAGPADAGIAVRARLVTEFNRQALLTLLAELQGMKPMAMVDVIKLRPGPAPARAELEIRVQMRVQDAPRETSP